MSSQSNVVDLTDEPWTDHIDLDELKAIDLACAVFEGNNPQERFLKQEGHFVCAHATSPDACDFWASRPALDTERRRTGEVSMDRSDHVGFSNAIDLEGMDVVNNQNYRDPRVDATDLDEMDCIDLDGQEELPSAIYIKRKKRQLEKFTDEESATLADAMNLDDNSISSRSDVIDLDLLDFDDENARLSSGVTIERGRARERRVEPEPEANQIMPEFHYNDMRLRPGKAVQLRFGTTLKDNYKTVLEFGYFMRIKVIFKRGQEHYIRGQLFRRNRELYGIMPMTAGEVSCLQEIAEVGVCNIVRIRKLCLTNLPVPEGRISVVDAKDEDAGLLLCRWKMNILDNPQGGSAAARVGELGHIRRLTEFEVDEGYKTSDKMLSKLWRGDATQMELLEHPTMTRSRLMEDSEFQSVRQGLTFSTTNSREDPPIVRSSRQSHNNSAYNLMTGSRSTCRQSLGNAFSAPNSPGRPHEGASMVMDESYRISISYSVPATVVDLTDKPVSVRGVSNSGAIANGDYEITESSRRYSFGDTFCGGGGVSAGARMAGLKVLFGFDKDPIAIKTWGQNFGNSRAHHCESYDFVTKRLVPDRRRFVDILHVSPPCQTFSWAKTTPGKDDEKNEASLYAVFTLLDYCRPRVVTVEQTDGMFFITGHNNHFFSLLQQFTALGYSVRWGILHAINYGVPSRRKRLILMASCPGERLPDFPKATHHDPYVANPSMTTFRACLPMVPTLGQALASIPLWAEDQEKTMLKAPMFNNLHELDRPLPRTIMATGGSYDFHPNGQRKFTVRELATISTFPVIHSFYGSMTAKKKQVGNAVPPKMAEAILRSAIKHLEEIDRERAGLDIL